MSLLELDEVRKDFGWLSEFDEFRFMMESGGVQALIFTNC